MAKWDAARRTNKLLKPAGMKLALTGSKANKSYGLGWHLYYEDDGSLYGYGHDGYWEGFNTMYYNYLSSNHSVGAAQQSAERPLIRTSSGKS